MIKCIQTAIAFKNSVKELDFFNKNKASLLYPHVVYSKVINGKNIIYKGEQQ